MPDTANPASAPGVRTTLSLLVLAALAGPAGCSFMLEFDTERRPCGPDHGCLDGYSCLDEVCVANHSLAVGDVCADTLQCKAGARCITPEQECRENCEVPLGGADDDCDGDSACVRAVEGDGSATAACLPSECTDSCQSIAGVARSCLTVKPGVQRCLTACQIECQTTGACSDDCPLTSGGGILACQPVAGDTLLACLPEGTRVHGQNCDLLNSACARGLACIRGPGQPLGTCLRLCNPAAATPCAGANDPSTGGAATCNANAGVNVCGSPP